MMKPRHTITKMEALDLMIDSIIVDHSSHERRNLRLSALRGILDDWIRDYARYQDTEDTEAKALTTFEAIYQLCIWQLDHETHVCVKTRLYMARSLISLFLIRRREAVMKGIEERSILAKIRANVARVEEQQIQEPEQSSDESQVLDNVPF
jgi:hypothetical protein